METYKQRISCVFLANTTDLEKYGTTQRAINSLLLFCPQYEINIVIVESNKSYLSQGFIYNTHVITPNEEFGYNRFLNLGIEELKRIYGDLSEWIIISNNDVIFTNNWLFNLLEWQKNHSEVLSLSPWEPNWHLKRGLDERKEFYIGYRTSFEITGWCLVIHKSVITKCNLFDPIFRFWYQDNDYALTLKKYNIIHALVVNSRVYHMVSASHDTINKDNKYKMTEGQLQILRNKWGHEI